MLVIPAEAGIQREFLLILSQFENIYHEFVIPAEAGIQGAAEAGIQGCLR